MKIVVTRSGEQADELVARLEALGHDVVRCPLIRIDPLGDEPIDPSPYDWVVVTSPNGARELARRLAGKPQRIAAIGPGTADALARAAGCTPTSCRRRTRRKDCSRSCRRAASCSRPPKERAGCSSTSEAPTSCRSIARSSYDRRPPAGDVALLASASAARALAATGARLPVVAIGPQTAAEAREHGLDVVAVADSYDLEGLLDVVSSL